MATPSDEPGMQARGRVAAVIEHEPPEVISIDSDATQCTVQCDQRNIPVPDRPGSPHCSGYYSPTGHGMLHASRTRGTLLTSRCAEGAKACQCRVVVVKRRVSHDLGKPACVAHWPCRTRPCWSTHCRCCR